MSANFIPVIYSIDPAFAGRRVQDAPEFNVSNSNAAAILASLGMEPNFVVPPPYSLEQVEAECVTFLRIASGTEADAQVAIRRTGNVIHFGRREGYMTDRVTQLLELVRHGLEQGATHLQVG